MVYMYSMSRVKQHWDINHLGSPTIARQLELMMTMKEDISTSKERRRMSHPQNFHVELK